MTLERYNTIIGAGYNGLGAAGMLAAKEILKDCNW